MTVTIATRPPLFMQIADGLRAQIEAGEFADRGYLPSEARLCEQWGCSRNPVRAALKILADEGLITPRDGKGHQLRTPLHKLVWHASEPEKNPGKRRFDDSWSRGVRAQGHEPFERITVAVEPAAADVAVALNIPTGTAVVVRSRIRDVDGDPSSTSTSYYPLSIVGGTELLDPADIIPGTFKVFERIGRAWTRTTDALTARLPTAVERADLNIPPGVAVHVVHRISVDRDEVPVRLNIIIIPADRYSILFDHPIGDHQP